VKNILFMVITSFFPLHEMNILPHNYPCIPDTEQYPILRKLRKKSEKSKNWGESIPPNTRRSISLIQHEELEYDLRLYAVLHLISVGCRCLVVKVRNIGLEFQVVLDEIV
jgi:hypothetical protein